MSVIFSPILSDTKIPHEGHFRISAGPGAGKTHWLVEHIKNVLQNSQKLDKAKKIACITYTNVAVDTILRRLDFVADRVEVSTIHSFLYKHVVKPYSTFIADEIGLNVKNMDGPEEHYPSRSKIKEWLSNHPNLNSLTHPYSFKQLTFLDQNLSALKNWIGTISYKIVSGELQIVVDNTRATSKKDGKETRLAAKACLAKLEPSLLLYKKLFWEKGRIHHEDILFIAYLLIRKYPYILTILRAKFPYFFIDEFQDTNPIQTEIIRQLGISNINIGVIGDKAQSIYKFQGAELENFSMFSLPELKDYIISDNRRSTNSIINVLNNIRPDLTQLPIRNEQGSKPMLYVGNMLNAISKAQSLCVNVTILARENIIANGLKRDLLSDIPSEDILARIFIADLNSDRRKAIVHCVNAIELARQKRFKDAIKEIERNFKDIPDRNLRKKISFEQLRHFLNVYDEFKKKPLLEFYQIVKDKIRPSLAKLAKGAALDFYSSFTYDQLALFINLKDDASNCRTIHKAKGDEFPNVILILREESNITFLTNPSLLKTELHRLFYVAISRAKDNLFIVVPALSAGDEFKLASLFDIERI